MKKLSLLLIGLIGYIQFAVAATTKAEADEAYQKEKFSEAASLYEEILQTQGESADIYYNLGNAYFKLKNTAKAVLNYERALLLNPGDADIRFNLGMARSKTVDKITPTAEVFIVTWHKSLVNMMSEQSWGYVGIFSVHSFADRSLFLYLRQPPLDKENRIHRSGGISDCDGVQQYFCQ